MQNWDSSTMFLQNTQITHTQSSKKFRFNWSEKKIVTPKRKKQFSTLIVNKINHFVAKIGWIWQKRLQKIVWFQLSSEISHRLSLLNYFRSNSLRFAYRAACWKFIFIAGLASFYKRYFVVHCTLHKYSYCKLSTVYKIRQDRGGMAKWKFVCFYSIFISFQFRFT